MAYNAPGGDPIGAGAVSMQPYRDVSSEVASGVNATAIGARTNAAGEGSVAVGDWAYADSDHAVAIAGNATAEDATAIGYYSDARAEGSVSIGSNSTTREIEAIAIGARAEARADHAIVIGADAFAYGLNGIAIGRYAAADDNNVMQLAGLSRHPNSFYGSSITDAGQMTAYRSAMPVRLMSGPINLQTLNASAVLRLPSNTRFWADDVGLILLAASSPTGSPQLSVTGLLTDEAITATAQWSRQVWTPGAHTGLTGDITVSVAAALASGTATARVYITGLLLQV
jgi:autotransporter adhesin